MKYRRMWGGKFAVFEFLISLLIVDAQVKVKMLQ